jgi:hypothetical protein
MNEEINKLNSVLSSLINSYRSIKESDLDGQIIDPIEYKLFNINYDDLDGDPI